LTQTMAEVMDQAARERRPTHVVADEIARARMVRPSQKAAA